MKLVLIYILFYFVERYNKETENHKAVVGCYIEKASKHEILNYCAKQGFRERAWVKEKGTSFIFRIDKVEVNEGVVWVYDKQMSGCVIDNCELYIFEAYDGFPVFKGDKVYLVDKNLNITAKIVDENWNYSERRDCKEFMTLETANKYVDDNTICEANPGDFVVVKNSGKTYTSHKSLFHEMRFKNKEHNEEFKNGTIAKCFGTRYCYLDKVLAIRQKDRESLIHAKGVRLATQDEILEYYKNEGFRKGAILKDGDKTFILDEFDIEKHKNCEVIGQYPTKHDVAFDYDKTPSISKVFNRLLSIRNEMIREYNKAHKRNWEADFRMIIDKKNNTQEKWTVSRYNGCLCVTVGYFSFNHFPFPTEELAEYSLKEHKELWKIYYQL